MRIQSRGRGDLSSTLVLKIIGILKTCHFPSKFLDGECNAPFAPLNTPLVSCRVVYALCNKSLLPCHLSQHMFGIYRIPLTVRSQVNEKKLEQRWLKKHLCEPACFSVSHSPRNFTHSDTHSVTHSLNLLIDFGL